MNEQTTQLLKSLAAKLGTTAATVVVVAAILSVAIADALWQLLLWVAP